MLVRQFAELDPNLKIAGNRNEASFFAIILHVSKHDHVLFETSATDSQYSIPIISPQLIIVVFLLALYHAFRDSIHHDRIAKTEHTIVENATNFILPSSQFSEWVGSDQVGDITNVTVFELAATDLKSE